MKKYPNLLLQGATTKYQNEQSYITETDNEEGTNKIRLVIHFNPRSLDFHKILHDQEGLLLLTRKEIIKPEDMQVTQSRSPNLKRHVDTR